MNDRRIACKDDCSPNYSAPKLIYETGSERKKEHIKYKSSDKQKRRYDLSKRKCNVY